MAEVRDNGAQDGEKLKITVFEMAESLRLRYSSWREVQETVFLFYIYKGLDRKVYPCFKDLSTKNQYL